MTRQTPLWLQAGTYPATLDRRLLGALWPTAAVTGCAVTINAGTMNMSISAGTVVAPAANNTGSVLCYSDAVEVVTSPTAPGSGSNRYDLVICQPRGNDLDGGSNNDFIFSVVSGTVAASPTVPSVPAGAVAIAQVYVTGGSAALSSANLTDLRPSPLAVNQANMPLGVMFMWAPSATYNGPGAAWADPVPGSSFTFTLNSQRRIRTAMSMQSGKDATNGIVTAGFRMDGNTTTRNQNYAGNLTYAWAGWHDWLIGPGTHTASFIGYSTAGVWSIVGLATMYTVEDVGSW